MESRISTQFKHIISRLGHRLANDPNLSEMDRYEIEGDIAHLTRRLEEE